jgi:hypothetical protein
MGTVTPNLNGPGSLQLTVTTTCWKLQVLAAVIQNIEDGNEHGRYKNHVDGNMSDPCSGVLEVGFVGSAARKKLQSL